MADIEYLDDSELVRAESLKGINYDDIEGGGSASPGEHLALIKKVKAQKHDWDAYTGVQAVVMFSIVDGPDKGKVAYDRIPMEHANEEEWKKNKRLLVAKRTGLMSREDKDTVNINWKLLEGKTVIIILEQGNDYKDKTSGLIKKGGVQMNTFKSYLDPAVAPAATGPAPSGAAASANAYNDI